jgi:hypothetical protein
MEKSIDTKKQYNDDYLNPIRRVTMTHEVIVGKKLDLNCLNVRISNEYCSDLCPWLKNNYNKEDKLIKDYCILVKSSLNRRLDGSIIRHSICMKHTEKRTRKANNE